jgi:4-hydroxybenzoate polyprenyltransferase
LSAQVIYTYNHLRELSFDADSNPERVRYLLRQRRWVPRLLIGYAVLLAVLLLVTNWLAALIVLAVVAAGVLYTDRVKELPVRHLVGFKDLYSSCFVGLTVFAIPVLYRVPIAPCYLYLFSCVFLRCLIATAFFDIKDIASDRGRQIRTFAAVLGKERTLLLLHGLNVFSIAPLLLGIHAHQLPAQASVLTLCVAYDYAYLARSRHLDGASLRTLSYITADAEFLVWLLLVALARLILH